MPDSKNCRATGKFSKCLQTTLFVNQLLPMHALARNCRFRYNWSLYPTLSERLQQDDQEKDEKNSAINMIYHTKVPPALEYKLLSTILYFPLKEELLKKIIRSRFFIS